MLHPKRKDSLHSTLQIPLLSRTLNLRKQRESNNGIWLKPSCKRLRKSQLISGDHPLPPRDSISPKIMVVVQSQTNSSRPMERDIKLHLLPNGNKWLDKTSKMHLRVRLRMEVISNLKILDTQLMTHQLSTTLTYTSAVMLSLPRNLENITLLIFHSLKFIFKERLDSINISTVLVEFQSKMNLV